MLYLIHLYPVEELSHSSPWLVDSQVASPCFAAQRVLCNDQGGMTVWTYNLTFQKQEPACPPNPSYSSIHDRDTFDKAVYQST